MTRKSSLLWMNPRQHPAPSVSDVTDKALFAAFYGWGVAEVLWKPATAGSLTPSVSFDRVVVRDRARFRFDRDGNAYLFASGSGWRQVPPRKFWSVAWPSSVADSPRSSPHSSC